MTLDDLFSEYIDLKRPLLTPHVITSYISIYDVHIYPVMGGNSLDGLNFSFYQKFANSLLGSGKAPKTVKNIISVLSGLYRFAIENDYWDGKNYPKMVQLPKFDNKYYIRFSPELQKKYIRAIATFDEPIFKDMFLYLLHGRRLGEVLGLKWEYLDLNLGMVYYPADSVKPRKNLQFQLTDKMTNIFKEYQAKEIELQGTVFVTGYVFKNPRTNKPYSGLAKPWKRLLEKNNLDHYKLHNIRHLLGSYLVNELGIRYEEVSYMLGHTDLRTASRYLNMKPSIAKNATDTLFESLKSKGDKSVDEVNAILNMGESIQKVLFSAAELQKVNQ